MYEVVGKGDAVGWGICNGRFNNQPGGRDTSDNTTNLATAAKDGG